MSLLIQWQKTSVKIISKPHHLTLVPLQKTRRVLKPRMRCSVKMRLTKTSLLSRTRRIKNSSRGRRLKWKMPSENLKNYLLRSLRRVWVKLLQIHSQKRCHFCKNKLIVQP